MRLRVAGATWTAIRAASNWQTRLAHDPGTRSGGRRTGRGSVGRGRYEREPSLELGPLPPWPACRHPSCAALAVRRSGRSIGWTDESASIPSCRRSAAMARNWSPRTVPSCLPIASAASRAERPAKNRSAIASRCSSVRPGQRRADGVELLADDGDLVRARRPRGPIRSTRVQLGVLVSRPDVVDDRIPGQPEEPAPEGNAPRLIARQRLQGLDEDELRQVLRVRRALDAAGDEAIDRVVVMIEDHPEGPAYPRRGPRPRDARSQRRRSS